MIGRITVIVGDANGIAVAVPVTIAVFRLVGAIGVTIPIAIAIAIAIARAGAGVACANGAVITSPARASDGRRLAAASVVSDDRRCEHRHLAPDEAVRHLPEVARRADDRLVDARLLLGLRSRRLGGSLERRAGSARRGRSALGARRRVHDPLALALDHHPQRIARRNHGHRARADQFAHAAVIGRCLDSAFGHLEGDSIAANRDDEGRALDHRRKIGRLDPEMGVRLLADVEQRATVVLDDLDEPAFARHFGNAQLRVLAQRHKLAPAHQHRRRACRSADRRPRQKFSARLRATLSTRVDHGDGALGFADGPDRALGKCRRGAEQQQK